MTAQHRYHISWIIACASIGIIAGTHLSLYLSLFSALLLLVSVILFVVACFRKDIVALSFALVAGLLCGLWRGGGELQAQQAFLPYVSRSVEVVGRVSDDPSLDIDGDTQLKLHEIVIDGTVFKGTMWVSTAEKLVIQRSDYVQLSGTLTEGFGTIPVAMYRAQVINVRHEAYADVGRNVRDWFASGIRRSIQEPQASLGSGFLLGQKTQLPEKLENDLRLLGLTHIVVASGYNLTILIRFARRIFVRISRFSALAFSLLFLYGFIHITGFSPSMSRASLIASLSLLAWYYGRAFHPFVLLPFSAAVTVLLNPTYAWGDIGWLLSFLSFVGVIIISPLIHTYFWGDDKPRALRQVCVETLSAQLATLPLIAYVFGQYSPLSLVANILIVPFIPLAMLLVLVAGGSGVLLGAAGEIIGAPAERLLQYMTSVVDRLAVLPLASSEIHVNILVTMSGYVALVGLIIFLKRRTKHQFREYNIVE